MTVTRGTVKEDFYKSSSAFVWYILCITAGVFSEYCQDMIKTSNVAGLHEKNNNTALPSIKPSKVIEILP